MNKRFVVKGSYKETQLSILACNILQQAINEADEQQIRLFDNYTVNNDIFVYRVLGEDACAIFRNGILDDENDIQDDMVREIARSLSNSMIFNPSYLEILSRSIDLDVVEILSWRKSHIYKYRHIIAKAIKKDKMKSFVAILQEKHSDNWAVTCIVKGFNEGKYTFDLQAG